jgi:hypothetical protein
VWPVSIEASSFVLGLSMGRGNGLRKLILLGYANHADKNGRGAYPSTKTIADYAECDIRTVQRHLGWLITAGYLHEGNRWSTTSTRDTAPSCTTWRCRPSRSTTGLPRTDGRAGTAPGQPRLDDAVAGHRPRSAGVTGCHPLKVRPGVTAAAIHG